MPGGGGSGRGGARKPCPAKALGLLWVSLKEQLIAGSGVKALLSWLPGSWEWHF